MALVLMLQLVTSAIVVCDLPEDAAASGALQACIDAAPAAATVAIAPGRYLIDRPIRITKSITLTTAGSFPPLAICRDDEARCATLVAAPAFAGDDGFLQIQSAANVALDHLILDGNRRERLESAGAIGCKAGRNRGGFNASASGCLNCRLFDLVSRNALCGTAFEWNGGGALVRYSTFRDNGDGSVPFMWADGFTALFAPESLIVDNLFEDNSDIGLIVGHGPRVQVARNVIRQRRQHAFAGLMLDNFNSSDLATHGDFRGAVVTANSIDCGAFGCGFGINLGPHAWYLSQNIVGGEVRNNRISGAVVGINIDGAGTRTDPIMVFANTIITLDERSPLPLCNRVVTSSRLNIAPDAWVSRRNDLRDIAGTRDWHGCQR